MKSASETQAEHGLELEHASAREAATREILSVISQSRDNEKPVFDVILRNAGRLCHVPFGGLYVVNDACTHASLAASLGARSAYLETALTQWSLEDDASVPRAIVEGRIVHVEDIADTEGYRRGDRQRVDAVEIEGIRTFLAVPLMRGEIAIGCIGVYRRDVQAFSAEQIALLQTFAQQAVIAIDNVRQFRELQTRLEREAATREILQVISRVRDDVNPVLETIVRNAARLCDSPDVGLHLVNEARTKSRLVCVSDADQGIFEIGQEFDLSLPHQTPTSIREGRVIHNPDIADDPLYRARDPIRVRLVEVDGVRSRLSVPLLKDGVAFGCINVNRHEVRPFTDAEIALIETFAQQAVIAIENVRQFRELQTRLEREAATREILQVISRSRDDDAPVFRSILENAQRLCGAPFGNLNMVSEDGTRLEIVADGLEVFEPFRPGWSWPIDSGLLVARSVREGAVLQLEDASQDPLYAAGDRDRVTVVEAGVRTVLTVPLVSNGVGIGSMGLYRREMRRFTPDEIALVQTFAEQAVIAIENVRQFKALEARTEEVQALNASLEARVDEQVGEIERMGRLKRFLPPAVAEMVVTQGEEILSSHRALIATLFCDIRGFTAFCETAEPEETIEVLQTYHEEMGRLISAHGGGVDKRMGDGIMVILNDPLPCADPAGNAVRLAIAMRARMQDLCKGWKRLGHRLGFGVGISLGYATVGMVGSEGRYDYTASGTTVNLAARLCDRAEDGEILLSPRARTAVDDDFETEAIGEIDFKGLREPVEVFRLAAATPTGTES